MRVNSPRVVIVGAGVAGLAAASRLFQNGFVDVVVLEAQSRIGGRVHTIPYNDGHLEIGAQWIHGEAGNPMHSFAIDNGLLDMSHGVACCGEGLGHYYTQNGDIIDGAIVKEVHQVMQEADDSCCQFLEPPVGTEDDDGRAALAVPQSVGHHFSHQFRNYLEKCNDPADIHEMKEGLFRWHLTFQCLDNACYSMGDISALTWGEFRYFQGAHWVNLRSGYHSIIDTMLSTLPEEVILIDKPVAIIDWGASIPSERINGSVPGSNQVNAINDEEESLGYWKDHKVSHNDVQGESQSGCYRGQALVRVQCADGTEFIADHIIITVSLGVLKQSHGRMFKPALPRQKRQAIANMGFGTLNKIYLHFETPFWDSETKGFQLVWTDMDFQQMPDDSNDDGHYPWYRDITGFDTVPEHPSVLLGWIGRYGAERMEKLSDSEVGDTCANLLKQFTGLPVTKVLRVIRSSWANNPYFRGSYSFRTVLSDMEGDHTSDLAEPVYTNDGLNSPVLLFAGEATEVHHFSTVHGAFMSGQREADRIIAYYRNKTCHSFQQ